MEVPTSHPAQHGVADPQRLRLVAPAGPAVHVEELGALAQAHGAAEHQRPAAVMAVAAAVAECVQVE